ncbi:hypothetical protein PORY_001703 [Pneumocystis oryctolagi]|uniref:Uncharacterized protein n=1 Tax=Pneumocystis oryctolagi TaxID=42067 RepID=A0ACB7CDJ2_9ASCO|nr:hypothetical protein PORY_001703 [Pneumocystis oryctolagi]
MRDDSSTKPVSDEWVIELLKKEALAREQESATVGIQAFLSKKQKKIQPTRTLNKRFLTKMVRNMDAHNVALVQKEAREATQRLRKLGQHAGECESKRRSSVDHSRFSHQHSQHKRSISFVKQQHTRESNKDPEKRLNKTSKEDCKINTINNKIQHNRTKPNISATPPQSPLIGPPIPSTYPHDNNACSSGTLMLNSHFDPNYDPKLDVTISSDEDDWEIALKAIKDISEWKRQNLQRQIQGEFSTNVVSKITQEMKSPVYSKGLREWDRGKVILENGEIDVKALDWKKT